MKLSKENVQSILNALEIAQLVNIDQILLTPDSIGGVAADMSAVVRGMIDNSFLGEYDVGINRPNILLSRANLCINDTKFSAECEVDDANKMIARITFKSSSTKVEYRCGNPDSISIANNITNQPKMFVTLTDELIDHLQKGQSAMGSEIVRIGIDHTGTGYLEFADLNKDLCTMDILVSYANHEEDEGSSISFNYSCKLLTSVLKKALKNNTEQIMIGTRGLMEITINDITIILTPKV